jgi:hypothetical protein
MPVAQYPHAPDGGDAIANGFVYRGKRIPALQGTLVFGDITTGRIWYAQMKEVLAADDGDPLTVAPLHELGTALRALSEETFRKRGGQGDNLPGFGAVAGRGRVDIRLPRTTMAKLYVLTKGRRDDSRNPGRSMNSAARKPRLGRRRKSERLMLMRKALVFVVAVSLGGVVLAAADWPQWQGPDRTRMSKETGLLKEWPAGGPRVIWTANNLGTGYGSMSVAGDRVFVQGARGQSSFVIALNRADGKEVWAKALGPIETRMRTNMGAGPRGTPTVDGDRLYVLTENGISPV